MKNTKNKVIVILGTTASGKTGLGVRLAHELNGEIISADSRQVYRGMDVGTGKDLDEYNYKDEKIPYHLIDVVDPKTRFHLSKYQRLAFMAIDDVLKRGKLPIIVGGTGQYLQAVVDNFKLSKVNPDKKLREKLEKLSSQELFFKLKEINSNFADKLNNSDKNNKRRLIRYVEVFQREGGFKFEKEKNKKYDFLLIGITWPKKELNERIYKRLVERFEKDDMADEVEMLHRKEKVSWKRLEEFGLEYRYIAKYLQKKLGYDEMVERLNIAVRQFAKKQMTWFSRWERQGTKIHWIKDKKKAMELINKFLK